MLILSLKAKYKEHVMILDSKYILDLIFLSAKLCGLHCGL